MKGQATAQMTSVVADADSVGKSRSSPVDVDVEKGEDEAVETPLGLGLQLSRSENRSFSSPFLSAPEDQHGRVVGHQPKDKAAPAYGADGDDERSDIGGDGDNDVTDEDASASDSASHGTTATSSGDSACRHDKSLSFSVCCDKASAKGCCLRWGGFVAFWVLVAGTIVVGKEMVELAYQREAELMEEEVRARARVRFCWSLSEHTSTSPSTFISLRLTTLHRHLL